MNITVNVEDVDLDSVIGPARYNPDGDEVEPNTLRDEVVSQLARRALQSLTQDDRLGLIRRIHEIRHEVIREKLEPIITEAIEGSIQPTNTFGEPIGEPKTLRDAIVKEARDLLKAKTDYGRGPTVVQKTIADEVRKTVDTALRDEVKVATAQARAAVQTKAAEFLAAQMGPK